MLNTTISTNSNLLLKPTRLLVEIICIQSLQTIFFTTKYPGSKYIKCTCFQTSETRLSFLQTSGAFCLLTQWIDRCTWQKSFDVCSSIFIGFIINLSYKSSSPAAGVEFLHAFSAPNTLDYPHLRCCVFTQSKNLYRSAQT